jgi:hypothetical protein
MTTITKALAATSFLLAVGVAYQLHLLYGQRAQSQALIRKIAALNLKIEQSRGQRDRTLAGLSAAHSLMESAQLPPDRPNRDSGLDAWLGRVRQLEQCLRQTPERKIPEMQYLNSNDWLSVTLDNQLDTDAKIRVALCKLRALAKAKPEVATNLSSALQAYRKANDGLLPSDPSQLRPYLNPSLSDDVLRRYGPAAEVAGENDANGAIRDGIMFLGSGKVVLQEKSPVDEDYDTWIGFMEKGGWATGRISQLGKTMDRAMQDFTQINNGQVATTSEQLLPYLPVSVDPGKLKEYWEVGRH